MMIRLLILLFCVTILAECKVIEAQNEVPQQIPRAKNIILLIGDGMGIGQISAGTYANSNYSELERFPIIGLHKPHASDSLITDSAAAATAIASGIKTYYGAIGVNQDTMPVPTILEEAELKGLSTGLVASSTIVNATQSSFISHNKSRKNYEEIASDFLKTDIEYFVGGGKKYFDRRDSDDRDLIKELRIKEYIVKDYLEDFSSHSTLLKKAGKFVYFTADSSPLSSEQGRDYLQDASIAGLKLLHRTSEEGFFMMIEGSQIDWGGHANNHNWIISEFKDFNRTLKAVLDWAEKDGETLVIVTGDHETGGYTIQPGSTMDSLVTAFTTTQHTGDFIPVFAYGPQSMLFSGVYENTAIYHKMREAYGWTD